MSHGGLHIAAGRFKGRKLLSPPGKGTRPMTGLAKKSLFGILQPRLDGAVVLDLYCGTGTLGLESLSLGASLACFGEKDRRVVERLHRNIEACGAAAESRIWAGNIESRLAHWLEALGRPVDIAFLDPPFPAVRKWDFARLERSLFAPLASHLAGDGLVVLRTPGDITPPDAIGELKQTRSKTYGDMIIAFYEKSPADVAAPDE